MSYKTKYTTLREVIEEIVKDFEPFENELPGRFFYNHFTNQMTVLEDDLTCNTPEKNWIFPSSTEVNIDKHLWEEFIFSKEHLIEHLADSKDLMKSDFFCDYYNSAFEDYNEELIRYEDGISEFDLSDELFESEIDFSILISNSLDIYFQNSLNCIEERDMKRYERREKLDEILQ